MDEGRLPPWEQFWQEATVKEVTSTHCKSRMDLRPCYHLSTWSYNGIPICEEHIARLLTNNSETLDVLMSNIHTLVTKRVGIG